MAASRYRGIAAGRCRLRVLVVTTADRRGAILAVCEAFAERLTTDGRDLIRVARR